MRATIMRDMDKLEHEKRQGFYDRDLDMYFDDLDRWCVFKWGVKLVKIL